MTNRTVYALCALYLLICWTLCVCLLVWVGGVLA